LGAFTAREQDAGLFCVIMGTPCASTTCTGIQKRIVRLRLTYVTYGENAGGVPGPEELKELLEMRTEKTTG